MKKYMRLLVITSALLLALSTALVACNNGATNPADTTDGVTTNADGSTNAPAGTTATPGTNPDGTPDTTPADPSAQAIVLTFNGNQLTPSVQDSGVTVDAASMAFIITRPGTYELKGDLSNGQVRVSVGKTGDVELILNNFTASSSKTAPLYIESANKATIVLAAGSVNSLTDSALYEFPVGEDKPNACLYSSDDLTIKGTGSLTVTGKYNNGIGCKNDLRIKEGTITVSAPNNIIKGNDSVEIEEATLKLSGGEDAIKSDTADRTDKGYILITAGAKVDITCSDDALQASMSVTVEAGATVTGNAGGDAINCPGTINADATAMQITAAGGSAN